MSEPISCLYICTNIPWDKSYKFLRTYKGEEEQLRSIESHAKFTMFSDFKYIRDEGAIRVPLNNERVKDCNYIAFKNSAYSDKWFFGFIDRTIYAAEGTTYIYFTIDMWQTWQFQIDFKSCFVEREHVINDEIGENIIDEGLGIGETICNEKYMFSIPYKWFMYSTTVPIEAIHMANWVRPGAKGNEYSACWRGELNRITEIDAIVEKFTEEGKLEAIVSVFAVLDLEGYNDISGPPNGVIGEVGKTYTPKNNKLYTYPYTYQTLLVPGTEKEFRYENFDGVPNYKIQMIIQPNMNAIIGPINYQQIQGSEQLTPDYTIPMGQAVSAAWSANTFQNMIAQQGPQLAISLGSNLGIAAAGYAGKDYKQAVSAVTNIATELANIRTASLVSETVKGTQACSSTFNYNAMRFWIKRMSIKYDYAVSIDNFFTVYGYKVNKIKVPNVKTRPYWNFVKTIDAKVGGAIPNSVAEIMETLLDNGVTFWHTDDVGNYELNNRVGD